jgi:hypothetical protein
MRTTSSSISSSDGRSARDRWRGFATTFLLAAAGALVGLVAAAYAIDPYGSGRSLLAAASGVRPQGPRTANASRGRDPRFDGAIIGNSHVQLLSPERLKAATGIAFVQLSVPGTGPKEQLVLLDWFLRHRERPARAVILGADPFWCTDDPALPNWNPFPFWLYSGDLAAYLRGLVRFDVLEELPRRLDFALSASPARAAPDGYWDYEADYLRLGQLRPEMLARRAPDYAALNRAGRFPAAERLRAAAGALPADLSLVLVFPPVLRAFLPPANASDAAIEQACKAALSQAVLVHPHAAVLDWQVDRAETRDPGLFFDATHYRRPVAEAIEADIAALLRRIR